MKAVNYGGVAAAESEAYDRIIEGDRREAEAGNAFWQGMKTAAIITIVSIVIDFFTLFTLFDKCFTQSALMIIMTSIGSAAALDTLPLIIAKYTHYVVYKTKRNAAIFLGVSLSGFILLLVFTLMLRFSYKDMYGQEQETVRLENTVTNERIEEENAGTDSGKSTSVVLFLGILPLITSIATFLIAYASDDEVKKRYEYHKKRGHELDEAISDLEAAIETMNIDVKRDLELDEMQMKAVMDEIMTRCNTLKARSRSYLAEYLAKPSATSKLSQEMLMGNADRPQQDVQEEHLAVGAQDEIETCRNGINADGVNADGIFINVA